MEDNYKFSKASHYLDQDSVKQNQFMLPNKSFTYKASTPKLHLQKLQHKSFTYKASTPKLHLQSFNTKASPTIASPIKVSPQKLYQQKLHQWRTTTNSQKLYTRDQDSVKQNQFMVPNKSFNSKASPTKLQLQSFTYKSFNTKASPTKLQLQNFTYKVSTQKLYPQ
ncbi:hypothetical protein ACFX12_008898 [Malus domestica]